MWSPNDWSSLPTQAERLQATSYIEASERSLENPSESTKSKLHAEQLRFWIAPVRCLPNDILSIIFVESCMVKWRATLTLGAVCRWWRNMLLDTPRAWACIRIQPTEKLMHHNLLDIWLSQCGSLKLHISLPPRASPNAVKAVCSHDQNIQCLSFFNNANILRNQFSQLEELRLGPSALYAYRCSSTTSTEDIRLSDTALPAEEEDVQILNVKRFPNHFRHYKNCIFTPTRIFGSKSLRSLLNRWSLSPSNLLQSHLQGSPRRTFLPPLSLDKLRRLSYINKAPIHQPAPYLQTPTLEVYQEFSSQGHMHIDFSSVTSLSIQAFNKAIDWRMFPSVTHIQICGSPDSISNSLLLLEANRGLCPNLSSVECIGFLIDSVVDRVGPALERRSLLTGKPIRLFLSNVGQFEIYLPCYTYCGCDAPLGRYPLDRYSEDLFRYDDDSDMSDEVDLPCDECGNYHDGLTGCADDDGGMFFCDACQETHRSDEDCVGVLLLEL